MFSAAYIIKKYNILAKKKFGQNFLTDEKILDRIVSSANITNGCNVLEIGSGPGGLTNAILKANPKKLVSLEIDKEWYEILSQEYKIYDNFELVNKDALTVNEQELFGGEKIKIVANLPYNIGTALLIKWINNLNIFHDFTLLLQKEVVDRIVAKPKTKSYGRLSVLVQSTCAVKKLFDLSPKSFTPQPKVISSLIAIVPKQNVQVNIHTLSEITLLLFSQRRKKIRHAVANKSMPDFVDLDKRAEELTVEEYVKLAKTILQ